MLHFIIGRPGTGKTRRVRDEIVRELGSSDRSVVVLVPEQQTVAWETAMARLLPPSANLRMEITNFTRLANSVFREYGGLASAVIDEGSRTLLLWRAMLSVWEQLEVYRTPDTKNGREDRNLPRLMRAVDDFKAAGISPAQAEEALDALIRQREDEDASGSAGDLVSRLRDAVLVYAAYEELLHRDAIDRGDLLDQLEKTLRLHPYFRGKAVFIDSFFSLTAPEERILRQIFASADDVWVSFAFDASQPEDVPDEMQFGEVRDFYKTALRLAARENRECEKILLTENCRHKNAPELAAVEKDLFRYAADLTGNVSRETPEQPRVEILRCADLYDEAEACASVIDRLLREGYACRDIAVVAHTIGTREGITDAVLRAHGIPCFLSESSAVSHSPAVRLILAALAVGANGWQRRDVIRLLKTGLTPVGASDDSPLSAHAGDAFESYTAAWNIRGRRMFTAPDGWSMNPSGYKTEITEVGRELLAAANAVREQLIPPLDRMLSVFDNGAAPVREIAERLVLFAEDYGAQERLSELGGAYRSIGMPTDAARAESSWDAVCQILDKMVHTLGDTALDAGRFSGLFARAAAALDVGTIPTAMDEVVLGSASGVRFDEVKCVIMLGTVDGEFPGTVSGEASFFDDRDKIALEAVGLNLGGPDTAMQTAREAFMFYRTAASASEKLILLAPVGQSKTLSEGALRIEKIVSAAGRSPVRTFAEMPLCEIVFHPATAEYLLSRRTDPEDLALLQALAGGKKQNTRVPLTAADDRIEGIAREQRMRLSQSRIETFLSCPFRYACRYRVKLAEEARAEITAADVGTFVHHVLERFFTEIPASSLPLPESEMRETADRIIADYIAELGRATGGDLARDGRLAYLFTRLKRHVTVFLRAISEELTQSEFRPAAFEMPIGLDRPDSAEPIRIRTPDGASVTLDGIADRVDVWNAPDGKQYLRIVDYKTGSKPFSMERVARGLDVQVLLYLFSVWKNGFGGQQSRTERVPAGAVYFTVRPAPVSSDHLLSAAEAEQRAEDKIERVGVYLDDPEILRAMDKELGGKFVPVKESGDGSLVGRGKTTLVTLEQFGELYEQLARVIGKIAGEMQSGVAAAKPQRTSGVDPCAWCANRYVCRRTEE